MDEQENQFMQEIELDEAFERWTRALSKDLTPDTLECLLKLSLSEIADLGGQDSRTYVELSGRLMRLLESQHRYGEASEIAHEYWPQMIHQHPDNPERWLFWAMELEQTGPIKNALYLTKVAVRYLIEDVGPDDATLYAARNHLRSLLLQHYDADGYKLVNYRYPSALTD